MISNLIDLLISNKYYSLFYVNVLFVAIKISIFVVSRSVIDGPNGALLLFIPLVHQRYCGAVITVIW